jgi:RNA polymerase sigma factor (TIGR02999 family)
MFRDRRVPADGSVFSSSPRYALLHHALRKRDRKTITAGKKIFMVDSGDRAAVDYLFSLTYEELRRLAATVRRGDPCATLNPTALVHEAWLKMAESGSVASISQLHFKRIAARAMRQVLVEAARRRNARKRGGGFDLSFVAFEDAFEQPSSGASELLKLDAALEDLARLNPRQAQMVEVRFFGGLDVSQAAEVLDVSEITILRDWRAAKAWLAQAMR